ncbi:MAG: T9SS type A sorting domain-containing protein, partial [Nitrosopumilus sp.]|nr:T9SS type A sorting domain-containing protein [Nitrosopumilus sp.]
DCDDNNAAINPTTVWYLDADNDGYYTGSGVTSCASPGTGYKYTGLTGGGDCNDANAAINPSATEVCDDIDNNCNGQIDEGLSMNTYYKDSDGDEYGNAAVTIISCSPPVGYVSNNTDCNDGDATVYPGAPELCDGKDNDCDGDIDEGVKITYYLDADNDGYGNLANAVQACTAPGGYVIVGGDCNDNDASINPGSIEICGNNIDENCDVQTDEGCNNKLLVSIDHVTVYESEGSAVLKVRLTRYNNAPVTVNYKTADGSARSKGNRNKPKDFTASRGTITIPAGTLSALINIEIDIDNIQESTEQFYVVLSKPVNAGIGQKRAIVTILDGSPETIAKKQTEIIYEAADKFSIKVIPNPSQHYFSIITRSNLDRPVTVKVMDVLGRLVESKQNISANTTFTIGENYKPGVYFMEVMQGKERKILRLVKIAD